MIFQDPMTSLNPYLRIARQMTEMLVEHKGMSERDARGKIAGGTGVGGNSGTG